MEREDNREDAAKRDRLWDWGGANSGSKNDAVQLGEFTTSVLPITTHHARKGRSDP